MGSSARKYWPETYRTPDLSPRQKLAIRLHQTGLVKTKAEAAKEAGLARGSFYNSSTQNPKMAEYARKIDEQLANETIQTGSIIKQLGRRAIGKVAEIMDNPLVKPEVQLKAAQDLADRSPETSKVINVNAQIASPLSEDQLADLRRAMILGANLAEKFPAAAQGSFVTVTDAGTARSLDLVKERAPLALPAGGDGAG